MTLATFRTSYRCAHLADMRLAIEDAAGGPPRRPPPSTPAPKGASPLTVTPEHSHSRYALPLALPPMFSQYKIASAKASQARTGSSEQLPHRQRMVPLSASIHGDFRSASKPARSSVDYMTDGTAQSIAEPTLENELLVGAEPSSVTQVEAAPSLDFAEVSEPRAYPKLDAVALAVATLASMDRDSTTFTAEPDDATLLSEQDSNSPLPSNNSVADSDGLVAGRDFDDEATSEATSNDNSDTSDTTSKDNSDASEAAGDGNSDTSETTSDDSSDDEPQAAPDSPIVDTEAIIRSIISRTLARRQSTPESDNEATSEDASDDDSDASETTSDDNSDASETARNDSSDDEPQALLILLLQISRQLYEASVSTLYTAQKELRAQIREVSEYQTRSLEAAERIKKALQQDQYSATVVSTSVNSAALDLAAFKQSVNSTAKDLPELNIRMEPRVHRPVGRNINSVKLAGFGHNSLKGVATPKSSTHAAKLFAKVESAVSFLIESSSRISAVSSAFGSSKSLKRTVSKDTSSRPRKLVKSAKSSTSVDSDEPEVSPLLPDITLSMASPPVRRRF
ncbi:hypothetical protein B0T26DRAFT_681049 [Lasiosphaeria miniovina]|uniref:Uncharacterized protein n=1 Tax=Lasiosphaeria miniovina TaxID=1954250 RepID=A0AA39ZTN2_9PEZI|nr:uncharacterized protein B0T26DRAFT_681049 [Lasiosphaeria miniovina]KAK0703365.1 hypothetical protein B0T26DRAFT_681049 [Lasiosphaeria miniovina]